MSQFSDAYTCQQASIRYTSQQGQISFNDQTHHRQWIILLHFTVGMYHIDNMESPPPPHPPTHMESPPPPTPHPPPPPPTHPPPTPSSSLNSQSLSVAHVCEILQQHACQHGRIMFTARRKWTLSISEV